MDCGGQPTQLAGLGLEYFGPFVQQVLINTGMCLEPVDVLLGEFIGGFQGVDFLFQFFKQFQVAGLLERGIVLNFMFLKDQN